MTLSEGFVKGDRTRWANGGWGLSKSNEIRSPKFDVVDKSIPSIRRSQLGLGQGFDSKMPDF